MARNYFKEQVAGEEADELVELLGYTLARGHAARKARYAKTSEEREAWKMVVRRIKPPGALTEAEATDDEGRAADFREAAETVNRIADNHREEDSGDGPV